MRVGIISDIHDNLINLDKCLAWCRQNKVDVLICCGDVSNIDTINEISHNFKKRIYLVRGNVDSWSEEDVSKFKNIECFGRIGNFSIAEYQVGICHEPYLIKKVLEKECQIVFYGHTHKPWIENKNNIQLVNPGALEGGHHKATFAFWDTAEKKLELKVLECITNTQI